MRPFESHPDELISASLTGDLTDVERRELEAHLSTCEVCRETLEAFSQQRQLLGGLPVSSVPKDLDPRVRTGIESGRFGPPWWRRPGGLLAGVASLATVAAAGVLAVFLLNGGTNRPQVGASIPPPSTSGLASTSPTPSASTPVPPTAAPLPLGMNPGDLVYTSLTGPKEERKLALIRDASGESASLTNPSQIAWGQPRRASLSPDGQMLAFATLLDGKGTWVIFATYLATDKTVQLGETFPQAFGDRLLWSPDGRYLAFTVEPVPQAGSSDVWLFDRSTGGVNPVTKAGNAYAASWAPLDNGMEKLWISLGSDDPTTVATQFPADGGLTFDDLLAKPLAKADGVWMPFVSPDGAKALFWRGTMGPDRGNFGWLFRQGGMPQLTNASAGGIPSWTSGTALFGDLQPDQAGQAFASGDFTWAHDSDSYAFWAGMWNGTPEGANYPDQNAVYAGRVSDGPLTRTSTLALGTMTTLEGDQLGVVDVGLSPDGAKAAVTLVYPSPEFGAAAFLRVTPTNSSGKPTEVGSAGVSPPPWLGPGTYVSRSAAP